MSTQGPAKRRGAQATDKPVKRTRVSRACDQCRIAREKCDGAQPTCSTCSTSRRACTYTATVKKRGIQPGYIRALELALAYLFQHDPQNETLINDKLAHGGSSSLLLSRDSKEANKLHKRWRKARFYTDVDKLLSGGEPSRRDPSEASSTDSEEEPPNAVGHSSAESIQNRDLKRSQEGCILTKPQEQTASIPARRPSELYARVSMPLDSWKLFEIYFTYIQCWLPVCEKHDLMKLSYSYPVEGLALSANLPDSGLHAELWSVLAVASMQDSERSTPMPSSDPSSMTPMRLYATAKSFIPEEAGHFDIGHVKALLNLAIVNITQSSMEAAWLHVAKASRILDMMDQTSLVISPRYTHTLYGCFVLDSMIATHFNQHPHSRAGDIRRLGKIDEDGLDEWQPWAGQSRSSSGQQLRTPVLALSTLNAMTDLVSLLHNDDMPTPDKVRLLKVWETSLPQKLAHTCATTLPATLTPPTILLRLTYHCTALALTSSQSWLLRSLNLLEQAQDEIGWESLPPVIRCLLGLIDNHSAAISSSHEIEVRLKRLKAAMGTAWRPIREHQVQLSTPEPHCAKQSASLLQPVAPSFMSRSFQRTPATNNTQSVPSPLDPILTEPFPMQVPTPQDNSFQDASVLTQVNAHYAELPSDLESFFDELASLDTMNNINTQPQFMQNLGFAPDASMADLFSEYIPMQSSAFMGHEEAESVNLDHFGFYDGA
ncbi:hypothetical protein CC86DRAFT_195843 [Ophiobolus disseminans]|uniref:Zn(2)-C6 fungal-type domain-containing protein n=1 Tax=Ophiobolus disseminans TaxID=1469910 RepID=A0A6A7A654_9PLEO|nr:hypothetical protein CC86DRAFT_195843 [Ophiobolus disseminans]